MTFLRRVPNFMIFVPSVRALNAVERLSAEFATGSTKLCGVVSRPTVLMVGLGYTTDCIQVLAILSASS